MRAILLIALIVAGCVTDTNVADMAVCARGAGPPPSVATPCGSLTCAPGQTCVALQPGAPARDLAQPVDGGGGGGGGPDDLHSCVVLPAECQLCGGCGDGLGGGGKQFGCFATICSPAGPWEWTGCRFDGATLTCIGV
jgi:hypothetical protein